MKLVAVLCLLAAAAVQVYTRPNGAPSGACTAIQPMGPHIDTNPSNSAVQSMDPFQIDLTQFQCPMGMAGYCYVPGETYQLSLYGQNCEQFRGLLVQARVNGTGDPVGMFSDFTLTTRESNCTPAESAVTHNSRVDKISEVMTWTAPANGTGHIAFHYAVVVILQQGVSNIWYGPNSTRLIYEVENAPLSPTTSPTTCPLPTTGSTPTTGGAPFTAAVSLWSLLALLGATYLL